MKMTPLDPNKPNVESYYCDIQINVMKYWNLDDSMKLIMLI